MMTEQDKKDMRILIRGQLEEQHGKPSNDSAIIVLGASLIVSLMFNVMLWLSRDEDRESLLACWESLP